MFLSILVPLSWCSSSNHVDLVRLWVLNTVMTIMTVIINIKILFMIIHFITTTTIIMTTIITIIILRSSSYHRDDAYPRLQATRRSQEALVESWTRLSNHSTTDSTNFTWVQEELTQKLEDLCLCLRVEDPKDFVMLLRIV